ncbi:MAG TPA: AAA family ATPase [Bryobacteraceae bacterium]|jgi:pilus assembly protein CpaE
MMSTFAGEAESLSMTALSVILIGPHEPRRRAVAQALVASQAKIAREVASYPEMDELPDILEGSHDVVIIDLDTDPERALDLVENVCSVDGSVTVIVHSAHSDQELLVRCMRAGAREFLAEPLAAMRVAESLVRAAARRDESRRHKKALGKLLVFVGSKGGAGVTTIASNVALAIARDSGRKASLIDFDFHLGNAALTLGVTTKFSVADALENVHRLDSDLLSVLVAEHQSGLSVLAAPDSVLSHRPEKAGIERLLRTARESFDFVVVDAGSEAPEVYDALFEAATIVYLVTQVGLAELRNTNRFVHRYFSGAAGDKLEIVLNRFAGRSIEIDEASISKALTRPAKWKVPNDYPAVHRAQNTGIPIVSEKNTISRAIHEIAQGASGQRPAIEKKRKFGLF